MNFEVEVIRRRPVFEIKVSGFLKVEAVSLLLEVLSTKKTEVDQVIINCGELNMVSSCFLGYLYDYCRRYSEMNVWLRRVNIQTFKMLEMCRFHHIIKYTL